MNARALELLPEYVLGTLSEAETREVASALESSPELRAEAAAIAEAFGVLAEALPPAPPPPSIKLRLLAEIGGNERYAPFAASLAKHFDLAVQKVQELLRWAADPTTAWEDGPFPGIRLLHFDGGAAVAGADVGFVRLPAGLHFPWHRHHGYEMNFVLEGSIRDWDGTVYGPGEAIIKEAGTEHEFFVSEDRDVIVGLVLFEGFDIIPEGKPQS